MFWGQLKVINFFRTKKKDKKLVDAFSKIKLELSDHLDAINDNTDEINMQQGSFAQIEAMINKLSERLDDVEAKIANLSGSRTIKADDFKNIILSQKENEVFVLLYSRTGDLLTYREISRTLGLNEEIVRKHVSSIIAKGIPVIKKYLDEKTYLLLDSDFRNLQAKENIIKVK